GDMNIRLAETNDEPVLAGLVQGFRDALAVLRASYGVLPSSGPADLEAARAELADYIEKRFPIYVAEDASGALAGYLVCRVDGDVVWAESLYVRPEYRRQGVGSALYAAAERLARSLGGDTPYNWVDPNNAAMIRFLQQRGYTVLNLIELRRPAPGESLPNRVNVGAFEFEGH
ncbi:MAG TPA: GNAT family N-acetyltransferase, partial [Anaerolineaceae bacterium]|nr:GNAT family N-acetyltransferase [Anaerolineaceae bacterium]